VRTFRGEVYRLKGMTPPHKASSSGRVLLDNGAEYFPGVINATFVEMPRVNVFNEDGRRYVP
jgi:hypothetical protein